MTTEANYKTACQWWTEIPNKWTPVGWRDHLHRFNVLWNGHVLAEPAVNRRTARWAGKGLQCGIVPSRNGDLPLNACSVDYSCQRTDDGMVRQGWEAGDAPELWTEWFSDGILFRSRVFAHMEGGRETRRGDEPLFAWIRLEIHDVCRPLPVDPEHGFLLTLEDPHVLPTMNIRDFMDYQGFAEDPMKQQGVARYRPNATLVKGHPYRRKLQLAGKAPAKGCRVLEPDGRVRIGVSSGAGCRRIRFGAPDKQAKFHRLHLQLPVRKGAFVDVLLPLLPCDPAVFKKEVAVGYDAAKRSANRYWKQQLKTPIRFETPEAEVNDVLRQSARFSLNLTEKNPANGKYCKINGSWVYADLWTTPMAMDLSMMMDMLGHHDTVRRYLEIFKEEQGTVVPPGDGYELHPGYYSTPALYKSIDWLADNGAVLWTICRHALLSGDAAFAREFADSIVKSCEWIRLNRTRTNHEGYKGVLPPAVATDAGTKIQAVWSVGWNHLGLCAAVQVLTWIEHPRAAEFAAEAKAYREDYVKALRHKCKSMPTWTDAKGKKRRLVPTALCGDAPEETRHAFYLDGGPLFHVFAGLLPASDPLMQDTLAWFREGPQLEYYRRDSNCWQVPVLDHEMSSCEPCYSWNVFHSRQLGDREKFLEGMYSLFAGSMSQQTRISCETRGGITGNVFAAPLAIYLARIALIDDEFKANQLHLLRLAPLAWLRPGDEGVYDRVPTIYGPVSLRTKVSKDGKTLDIAYEGKFRIPPKKVILHIPPMPGLKTVKVNGKKATPKGGKVALQEKGK